MSALRRWATTTLFRWLAINIAFAIMIWLGMNLAFIKSAGVWARPDLPNAGLFAQAAATVRVLGSAPADMRSRLARGSGTSLFAVAWYSGDAQLPVPIANATFAAGEAKIRQLLGRPHARVVAYKPGEVSIHGHRLANYKLAIDLPDGSWVLLTTFARSWGLGAWSRLTLIALFALISTLLVAAIASRRLARPLSSFSQAAQRLSRDIDAPPMTATGPREFQSAARAFNDMQSRLRRFVTDRTTMLAAISHDLRTPLTRMRLRGEFIDDAEQQRKLFRDVDDMQQMITAALDFFRDDGQPESPTRFNLTELIHTIVDDFRDTGSDVSLQPCPTRHLFGRPLALRRAISNLVDNAIKYGHRARLSMQLSDRELRLHIDDDGPGIPDDMAEAVFRPFTRVETSRNRNSGGVGLGLATARSIARAHGGDLVISRQAQGMRATVTLPTSL